MSSYFGSFPSPSSQPPAPDMAARKEALMRNLKSELAISNAQELLSTVNEKCFAKCITKPSSSLSSTEETCLSRCLDRYMEAFDIVSRTYASRVQKQREEETI